MEYQMKHCKSHLRDHHLNQAKTSRTKTHIPVVFDPNWTKHEIA